MAGNSQRRGAIRKGGTKKGQVVGSGGQRRRGLEGRGATPKAEDRPYHPAARRARAAAKQADSRAGGGGSRRPAGRKAEDGPEMVLGRNPIVECLRAGVPATALYVAIGAESDEQLKALSSARRDGDLDPRGAARRTGSPRQRHAQGIGLQVPAYRYAHPDDLIASARDNHERPLLVALDNITDPRNLGAVIRSVAAFGDAVW